MTALQDSNVRHSVSLADEGAVKEMLIETVFRLWGIVNDLTRLRPTRHGTYRAANSRISDDSIADDSSQLLRLQILQQAGASVLAQSNQAPALALQLLR